MRLERGERVLTWAPLAAGAGTVAATDRALHVLTGSGSSEIATLRWHEMLRAVWEADSSTLVLDVSVEPDGSRRERLALDGGGHRLPETVRERVTSSIVLAQHVPLIGRAGVRVVARRVPGRSDLLWQLHPDSGIDLRRTELRASAEASLEAIRASLAS